MTAPAKTPDHTTAGQRVSAGEPKYRVGQTVDVPLCGVRNANVPGTVSGVVCGFALNRDHAEPYYIYDIRVAGQNLSFSEPEIKQSSDAAAKAPDHATVPQRVSADQVARDERYVKEFRLIVGDEFFMSAGYPADLREAREQRDAALAENDRLRAELATHTKERDETRSHGLMSASQLLASNRYAGKGSEDENSLVGMFARGVRHARITLEKAALAARTREAGHD